AAPWYEPGEGVFEFPRRHIDLVARGAQPGGGIVAPRLDETRLQRRHRGGPAVVDGLRQLLQHLAKRASRRLRRFARRLKLRHHTRTRGDQVLERALDQRRKQEFPRIGLALATEAA